MAASEAWAASVLTEDQQWRKLELVVETARQVWAV